MANSQGFHQYLISCKTRVFFIIMVLVMADKFTARMRVQFSVKALIFSTQLQHRDKSNTFRTRQSFNFANMRIVEAEGWIH